MRILIQLVERESPDLPHEVRRELDAHGATNVRASHPELQGLYTAVLPTADAASRVVEALGRLPVVRHAEIDSLRTTLNE